VVLSVCIYLAQLFRNLLGMLLQQSGMNGFIRACFIHLAIAVADAFLLYLAVGIGSRLLALPPPPSTGTSEPRHKKVFPLFAVVVPVMTAALCLLLVPIGKGLPDLLIQESKILLDKGDAYRLGGLPMLAVRSYNEAYSKLYSLEGFLLALDGLDSGKADPQTVGNDAFTKACRWGTRSSTRNSASMCTTTTMARLQDRAPWFHPKNQTSIFTARRI